MANFRQQISVIQAGEPVSAGVANRPLWELLENDLALRQRLETLIQSRAIVDSQAVLADYVKVGQAVYFHAGRARYEPALAAVQQTPTGRLVWSDAAYVQGLVLRKEHATLGDVLLAGLSYLDLSQSVAGTPRPGPYFLSSAEPGALVPEPPPAGILVCTVGAARADGKYRVHVSPRLMDLLSSHEHLIYELVCRPAGSHQPPVPNGRHEITDPDPTLEGWLPADHPSFAGKAPPQARFGYNLAVSPLRAWWPPVPLDSVTLEWYRGHDPAALSQLVPLGPQGLCLINLEGIWWLSNCYGEVPWPISWEDSWASVSETSSVSETCPYLGEMRLRLGFSRMLFQTVNSAVLSLKTEPQSGLELVCRPSGLPGETGHLLLRRRESWRRHPGNNEPGHLAFKRLSDDGWMYFGPVVEGLRIAGQNAIVSSTGPTLAGGYRTGQISLTVVNVPEGMELPVFELRLDGVSTQYFKDVPTLMFPAGTTVSLRGSVFVPGHLELPDTARFRFRFWGLARHSGSIPDDLLLLSYRRISRPSSNLTPVALPDTDTVLDLTMNVSLTTADQYYSFVSDPIIAQAGDLVLFTLTRNGSASYTHDFHLVRQALTISLTG